MDASLRAEVRFPSGNDTCAAWKYPGTNGACVVMAAGYGVTKEPGTDRFAAAFRAAGYTVVAFDFRNFGGSGGRPRQVGRVSGQLDDFAAAVAFARTLPEVDPDRIAVWGFSLAGGHVFRLAAALPGLAAAIAQTPNADGLAATRNAGRYTTGRALARVTGRGVFDLLGGLAGRPPRLLPLTGAPGSVAMLSTPDALGGDAALDPDGAYADWPRTIAARAVLSLPAYRPGRAAARARCPLLVVVADDDRTALAGPAVAAAGRAPDAELVRVPGGHYAPFLDQHDTVVAAELSFLSRRVSGRPTGPATGPTSGGHSG
ncbi:alpha/beta fold hydrolase [Cryptosporangium phraense]|uniref:Alpha/beta hydrolase n=1 Tax=Cryptosporangium phraense TaxID=2593070 RepID=A0A545ARY9_9ACTN|nr:alpha/beta hydrolase [Cryptosporangium phraense]TQS44102.1 alpha/beta hydrolase [Cryptosporangium phraense]